MYAIRSYYGGVLTQEVSFTNYGTLLQAKKSAFFNGETFDGEIVLGRTDESTKPNKVDLKLDGRVLKETEYTIEGGKVKLNVITSYSIHYTKLYDFFILHLRHADCRWLSRFKML